MFCCGKLLYGAIPCAFGVSSKCADVVGDTTLQVAKVDENIIVSFRRYRFGILQSRLGICAAVADSFFRYFQSAISRMVAFTLAPFSVRSYTLGCATVGANVVSVLN